MSSKTKYKRLKDIDPDYNYNDRISLFGLECFHPFGIDDGDFDRYDFLSLLKDILSDEKIVLNKYHHLTKKTVTKLTASRKRNTLKSHLYNRRLVNFNKLSHLVSEEQLLKIGREEIKEHHPTKYMYGRHSKEEIEELKSIPQEIRTSREEYEVRHYQSQEDEIRLYDEHYSSKESILMEGSDIFIPSFTQDYYEKLIEKEYDTYKNVSFYFIKKEYKFVMVKNNRQADIETFPTYMIREIVIQILRSQGKLTRIKTDYLIN